MNRRLVFFAGVLLLLIFGGKTYPLSDRQEIRIGAQAARQIEGRYGVWRDSAWEERISRVSGRLVRCTKRNLPYTFTLLNNPEANAFALPGGFIFINRGLLPFLKNDDEVAAVVAHEISHVELDHFGQEVARSTTFNWLGFAAVVLTRGAAQPWVNLAALSYNFFLAPHWSRMQETQADLHGVDLMIQAGFNPYGMVDLFSEMEKKEGDKGPIIPWMASHPHFSDRIAAIKEEIAKDHYVASPVLSGRAIRGKEFPADARTAPASPDAARHGGGEPQEASTGR